MVIFGLVLGIIRDANEITLTNSILAGVTSGDIYNRAITIDTLIQHSNEQILLLAMSLLKLGIGGSIFFIVKNLHSTQKHAVNRLASNTATPKPPFFTRLFPRLLIFGTDVQFINVGVLMTIWDLNAINLLHLQSIGQTQGPAFVQAMTIERLIGTLVVPVEFFGATLMLAGIPLGLASIVYFLRLQLSMLPHMLESQIVKRVLIFRAYSTGEKGDTYRSESSAKYAISRKPLFLTLVGLAIGLSGLIVVSPFRTINLFQILREEFSGQTSSITYDSLTLVDRLTGMTTEQWLFVGLGLLIFSINLWLLHIIDGLRNTRQTFSGLLTSIVGVKITPVEKQLLVTRLILPFAITGLVLIFVNFLLGLAADSAFITQFQLTGSKNSVEFQQAIINGGVYTIFTRNVKLAGFGFLLSGVGFSLVTIIINLKLTASTFLNVFPRLIAFVTSGGKRSETAEEIALPLPMSLAPWRLFAIIALGAVISISTMIPFAFLEAENFISYQNLAFAGQISSPDFASLFLSERLWEHTLLPWKLLGMGLMLFGVGRTFGVILAFVRARTTIIREFIDSVATTVAEPKTAETELR